MLSRIAPVMVVLALVLPMTGCSSNNKGKIEGTTWTVTGGTISIANSLIGVDYEFTTDGRLLVAGKEIAKYSLGMGDRLNMDIMDLKTGKSKRDFTNLKITGDTMTMTDSDKTYISFKRKATGAAPAPAPGGAEKK